MDNREFDYKSLVESEGPRETWEELYQLAYHDMNTGLPNKNYWNKYAPLIYDDVVIKKGGEMCVACFDFDWMKMINAMLGHLDTDNLMADAGKLLVAKLNFRKGHDLVTRWGLDEFFVALPFTSVDQTVSVCQRVLDNMRHLETEYVISPTATVGVASSNMGFTSFIELVKAADFTLSKAKENPTQKGKVFVHTPGI